MTGRTPEFFTVLTVALSNRIVQYSRTFKDVCTVRGYVKIFVTHDMYC